MKKRMRKNWVMMRKDMSCFLMRSDWDPAAAVVVPASCSG